MRSLARQHTSFAVRVLVGIARQSKSEPARVAAATQLLDRGWGKPQQDLTVSGDVQVIIRKMLEGDDAKVIDVVAQALPSSDETSSSSS